MILILFGVTGVGKTTIGQMVAAQLAWRFLDADDFHSDANKHKMQSGIPLTDEDRLPWLHALNAHMRELAGSNQNAVLACSALKQEYRDLLVLGLSTQQFRFALLQAPLELLAKRLRERSHPYMNAALLNSQLATLEIPSDVWQVSVVGTPAEAADQVLQLFRGATQSKESEESTGSKR